jgi:hypothetical protein
MKLLTSDGRGQSGTANTAVALVLALAIVGLLSAVLLPVAVNELNANETVTLNQSVGDTDEVNAVLNATLDSSTAGTEATYTLNVTDPGGASTQKTITEGGEETFSFDRGDVTVNVSEARSGGATATFTYNSDFSYSSGGRSLWGVLDLVIVLAAFLFSIGLAIRQIN